MIMKKIMSKCGLLLTLTLLIAGVVAAQTVTGKVTDSSGAGLPGVSVAVKNGRTTTQTNANGVYTINAASGSTLVFSSIGYANMEEPVNGRTTIDITLTASSSSAGLSEVLVVSVGYGTSRKKDLTGSVGSVTAKNFNGGIIASPDQLLQSKVAGLEITQSSGQPGAATTIKIRGNNSIRTASNPLYVIDGVPLDGRTARPSLDLGANGLPFGPTPESNPLLYINPNDISQIDILKDASSAAIYGSRGANGVIVITTKKGGSGPMKLEAGTNWGINTGYMKKYDIMSADEFRQQSKANNLNSQDAGSNVKAMKEITQHNLTQNYNLALSGGNDVGRFRASFLGSTTKGFLKKTSLDKYLGNFGGNYRFFDKRLTIDFDVITGHTKENMTLLSNTAGAGGNLLSWALNWNPTNPFYNTDGSYNNAIKNNFSIPNPLAVLDAFSDVADVNTTLANISASLRIIKGLDYKFLYAINHGAGTRLTNFGGWIEGVQGISGSGLGIRSTASLTSQTYTHTLNYGTSLTAALKLDAVVGYEFFKSSYSNSSLAASGFNTNLVQSKRIAIPYTNFMQNASTRYPLSFKMDPNTEIQSVFGRVNFNMSDKYYLTATLRGDGSNKFGKNNRYGYFPSVGVKWNIGEETFLKGNGIFSNLSLRGSWGITGNQEFPSGASLEQFSSTAYDAAGQTNVSNSYLKWEKTQSSNIGLDYSILKNRISGSIDYYHKNTTDLLFQSSAIQPAPASVFFINLPADLINSGVEFAINGTIASGKKFGWEAGFNFAYNKNILKNFSQAPIQTGVVNGNGLSDLRIQRITNNQPVNVYFAKPFRGFDKSTGQQIVGDTAIFAGDPNPHVVLGFSNTLRCNKWTLTFNMGGSFGYKIYNNTLNAVTNIYPFSKGQNVSSSVFGTGESVSDGAVGSTRYLENGGFLKLRNATLTYAFGNVGSYVKNLNAFVSGTNLFVITKFHGFDPEVNIDKSYNDYPSRNIEYLPYPTARTISFGFNFSL